MICFAGTSLPQPDIFGKSLYTFYIGQNDFTGNLRSLGISGVKKYLPQVVSQIASTIKVKYARYNKLNLSCCKYKYILILVFPTNLQELHGLGGRTFLVHNLAPIGCYPMFLVELPHNSSDIDQFGCMISYNNAVVEYNAMLKEVLTQTRKDIPDANVIYTDVHSVMLELFQHPTSHGTIYR